MRCISGNDIPFLLRQIAVPPKQLWVEGGLRPDATGQDDSTRYLCVVGSRKHSTYGREACEHLISGLRGYNICIVSGLALGIDSIAHEAALAAGLITLAFPGSGLDRSVLYPGSRHTLARRIIEAGGALISEFEPTQPSMVWTFPQRNRLMAGMCHATLLIEAAENSGTLITAMYALDANRDVLALPGSIFSLLTYGPHKQIHLGAIIVRSSADILEALHLEGSEAKPDAKSIASSGAKTSARQNNVSNDEQRILDLVSVEPMPRDELGRTLHIDTMSLSILLSELEIKNLIKVSGSMVSIYV
jgi:DNA processing protein